MKLFKFLYDFFWGTDDQTQPYHKKTTSSRPASSYRHTSSRYSSSNRQTSGNGVWNGYCSPDAYRGTEQECLTEYYGDEDPDCGFHSYSGAYYEDDGDSGCGGFFGGDGEE